MFDVISIGDATIDTFLFIHDIEIKDIDSQKKAIINWGDKLPVDEFYRTVAGNAANNAVASSRLGLKTGFYTVLAHDVGGREIVHKMQKEGVSGRFIVIDDKHGTNASTVLVNEGERTIFVYHEHRNYKLPNFPASEYVYLTSLGKGFEYLYKDLSKYVKKYKAKMFFNPGTFQLRAGVKKNKEILENTETLSLNVEEAQSWVGECGRDVREICHKLLKLGPRSALVTDGAAGAYSLGREGFFFVEKFPTKIKEATGAGDAFTTGYMAARFYRHDPGTALMWGAVNSASVVSKVGPQAGLLSRHAIQTQLKKHKRYHAVELD